MYKNQLAIVVLGTLFFGLVSVLTWVLDTRDLPSTQKSAVTQQAQSVSLNSATHANSDDNAQLSNTASAKPTENKAL